MVKKVLPKVTKCDSAMKETCKWSDDEYGDLSAWVTGCGEVFTLNVGTPYENKFKFCPFCGKEISQN